MSWIIRLLAEKAANPHLLVMSATPIPRTLALVIYGDLDVSVIDQLPPGRQKVDTFALGESYRPRVNAFLRKQVQEGHQVFIVCPLVGDGDTLPDERKAVTAYAKKLQEETFPDLRVSVLHGKMKPKEKEKVMETFAAGGSDVLVSTTVVEVGVDVPNATCMVVENAERFGLSQLHQLRGRVGRGSAKAWCVLVSDNKNPETRQRLRTLCGTNDGYGSDDAAVVSKINAARPGFVMVCLGVPKQEKWMYAHKDHVNGVMIGVGAGFDYHAGNIKRAPGWMQKLSLEWLYRLLQDPKRLFKRYLVTNTRYLWLVHPK